MISILQVAGLALALSALPLSAAEFFVSPQGNDKNPGLSEGEAFQTVQRGVDALAPGDTLTIAPGEYFGAVYRQGLGAEGVATVIRAKIPGTVLLRGDRAVNGFEKVPATRSVYQVALEQEPQAVNEVDTLSKLTPLTSVQQLETEPGAYFYDAEAKKLFLSTTDFLPPARHLYRASVTRGHGFFLENPRGVKISGLAATGFDSSTAMKRGVPGYHAGFSSAWGFIIFGGRQCTFENLTSYLNGGGIAFQNRSFKGEEYLGGGNLTTGCTAYANGSKFAMEGGDIATYFPNGDVIQHCTSYLGQPNGIRLYQRAGEFSWVRDCFARGNPTMGIQNKGKMAFENTKVERSISLSTLSSLQVDKSIIGTYNYYHRMERVETGLDNIYLSRGKVDQNVEFADPENFDFRLQLTSRFRNSGPGGADRGPYPYKPNIFYVKPDGNDSADGLSLSTAWRSGKKALDQIKAGDTVYFEPGEYEIGEVTLKNLAGADTRTFLRGRGRKAPVLRGSLLLNNCKKVSIERLIIHGPVRVIGGEDVRVENCTIAAAPIGIEIDGAANLSVKHTRFKGFQKAALLVKEREDARLFLQSNQYENGNTPALIVPSPEVVNYSGYNQFENPAVAWNIAGNIQALDQLQPIRELASGNLFQKVENEPFTPPAGGAFGLAAGPNPPFQRELKITKPSVRNVTATTVNLEWYSSLPATCEVQWGPTEACEHRDSFDVNGFGSYSLTGLEPGKTYYFRIASIRIPEMLEETVPASLASDWKPQLISFTTAKSDPQPKTYYVSTQGDDSKSGLSPEEAWRHINHAAQAVAPGDTVIVDGGDYSEQVVIPAAGEKGRPITFKAKEGAIVTLDGNQRTLSRGFFAGGKAHLRFDGFRSRLFGLPNEGRWSLSVGGVFHLYHCRDVGITRCFNDGRGHGYSAPLAQAIDVKGLLIKNCVAIRNAGAIRLRECADAVIENNVVLLSNIQNLVLSNNPEDKIRIRNNILGDNQKSKSHVQTFEIRSSASLDEGNNCYFLRIPDEQRKPFLCGDLGDERRLTAAEFNQRFGKEPSLVMNPLFAALTRIPVDASGEEDYGGDAILKVNPLDFKDFFPTEPKVLEKGIGLEPEAFGLLPGHARN